MSPQQLAFDLPARPALEREDFFVSVANAQAVALIEGWRDWPARKLALSGPRGAGKTHLAHVWAARAGAGHGAQGHAATGCRGAGQSRWLTPSSVTRALQSADIRPA
jgi:hypothetical protein